MPAFKDLSGKRFGKLTAIKQGDKATGRYKWLVRCECGVEKYIRGSDLTSGHISSCGCTRSENNVRYWQGKKPPNTLDTGVAAFRSLYRRYKYAAMQRGYDFSLTEEQFKKLTSRTCYYCGRNPNQIVADYGSMNGSYFFNGVDRINNDLGYVLENCVTCCKICNRAKHSLTHEEFMLWIKDLVDYNEKER